MAYNRKSKGDRYSIEMRSSLSDEMGFDIVIHKEEMLDSRFIRAMNDTLFGRIDSILDYRNNKSGWMLWFNIGDRYCFQPGNGNDQNFQGGGGIFEKFSARGGYFSGSSQF